MEEFLLGLIGKKNLTSAWKKKPFVMIGIILLFIINWVGAIFLTALSDKLFLLPILKNVDILFIGRAYSLISSSILFALLFVLIVGFEFLFYLIIQDIVNKFKENNPAVYEEKLKIFNTKVISCFALFFIIVFLLILISSYFNSYNKVSIFTEDKIYYSSILSPIQKEYDYSDITNADLYNKNDGNIHMTLYMENGKKVELRTDGNVQSDIEKYQDDSYYFIEDLVSRFREDNVPINYKCTFEDVSFYTGEEYDDILHRIFDQ